MTSVLVVDDDDAFRTTIGRDLVKQGFDVLLAQTVDEAIATLTQQQIDVLLTDLRMPSRDGIDLLDCVRSVSRRTRAILMSGFASARDYQRAIECGAIRVLCKPFTSSELMQAIRQAIDCETGFRGSIHGLSLVDLLQMFHYARRSLVIIVDGWAEGHIYLVEGRIVHATYREQIGELALRSILSMPAGSLRTMVLPEGPPHSITRDFSTLLLDALRELDETTPRVDRDIAELELAEFEEAPVVHANPSRAAEPLEGLRRLDGCRAACVVDIETGLVVGTDVGSAELDLRVAAAGCAELFRLETSLVTRVTPDDRLEHLLVTIADCYHIVQAIHARPGLCLYVVLDRRAGNLGLARFALAAAEAAFDA